MESLPAIAIASSFTAQPVSDSLHYWLDRLNIKARVEFAPYNHIIPTLLDPRGCFALNRDGLNVVLLRFEDSERFVNHSDNESLGKRLERAREQNLELIDALKRAASTVISPILVWIGPPSAAVLGNRDRREVSLEANQDFRNCLMALPSIWCLSGAELFETYFVKHYHDAVAERLGHVPYTPEAFAALGTAVIRVFQASRRPPFKVIVLDCDNTLWRGVCSERGPCGVELDTASLALQTFMKARQMAGMLLCVCSKNDLEDVESTFDANPAMPLKKSDFIAWRVNWRAKSENIKALAAELSLSLDSFIFVDDNPQETAEVSCNCPGVLALTLPSDPDDVSRFLNHVWAFDQNNVTSEDRQRTAMYQENLSRERFRGASESYAQFIAGLRLKIEIRKLTSDTEITRAAQMTRRTNQLNFTTERFTEFELRELLESGSAHVLTAFVSDRFGEYGQAALVIFRIAGNVLYLDNLLVSCRVLGKGVEHAMIARLGQIAVSKSLSAVKIAFRPTAKNAPAREFFQSLGANSDEGELHLLAATAATVRFSITGDWTPSPEPQPEPEVISHVRRSEDRVDFAWIATHCGDARSILRAIEAVVKRRAPDAITEDPRDETETKLKSIWERALRTSPIGIHDNFFELGGESLIALRILADVEALTGRVLSLATLIEAPTIAVLAGRLGAALEPKRWNCIVPIRPGGERPPFFCVHGVGGNVFEFVDLAFQLPSGQPFYGIQAAGLEGAVDSIKSTVEEMSELYIREIREFQPEGPYYLGGSSLGGLIGYEIARQLTAAGQAVAFLAMFDTSVPGAVNPNFTTETWKLKIHQFWYRVTLHWSNILIQSSHERLRYLTAKGKRISVSSRDRLIKGRGSVGVFEIARSVREAGQRAAASYVPGKYSGSMTLFRATEQPPWITQERNLGWGNLVEGEIRIYDTPGHHADLVRNPRARQLARQLDEALCEAQARQTVSVRAETKRAWLPNI